MALTIIVGGMTTWRHYHELYAVWQWTLHPQWAEQNNRVWISRYSECMFSPPLNSDEKIAMCNAQYPKELLVPQIYFPEETLLMFLKGQASLVVGLALVYSVAVGFIPRRSNEPP
jgi:hypothetical protein